MQQTFTIHGKRYSEPNYSAVVMKDGVVIMVFPGCTWPQAEKIAKSLAVQHKLAQVFVATSNHGDLLYRLAMFPDLILCFCSRSRSVSYSIQLRRFFRGFSRN